MLAYYRVDIPVPNPNFGNAPTNSESDCGFPPLAVVVVVVVLCCGFLDDRHPPLAPVSMYAKKKWWSISFDAR